MSDKPILFSRLMVTANLDGVKDQTRRVIVSSHIHLPTKGSCFPADKYLLNWGVSCDIAAPSLTMVCGLMPQNVNSGTWVTS
jgi:hypothetical protein